MQYDPNFPFGYTPYYQQKQAQTNTYAFVNGLEGAKNYPVMANQSILLMDSEQQVCYLKSSNALGQSTLRCFRLLEIKEEELVKKPVNQEVEDLRKELEELKKKLGGNNEQSV